MPEKKVENYLNYKQQVEREKLAAHYNKQKYLRLEDS